MLSKFINLFKFVWYHPLNDNSRLDTIVELNGTGKRYGVDDDEIHKLPFSKKSETFRYNPLKQQLISLNVKFNSVGNTLYLRKINDVKQRVFKKSICTGY